MRWDNQTLQGLKSHCELCKRGAQIWIPDTSGREREETEKGHQMEIKFKSTFSSTFEAKYRRKEEKIKLQVEQTYCCQHSQIILATKGSSSLGISRRRFWKPTAPTTCIGFIPLHGNLRVASSHRITPKL